MKKTIESSKVSIQSQVMEVEQKLRLSPKQKLTLMRLSQKPEGRTLTWNSREDDDTILQEMQLAVKRGPNEREAKGINVKLNDLWRSAAILVRERKRKELHDLTDAIHSAAEELKQEKLFITPAGLEYLDKGKVIIIV